MEGTQLKLFYHFSSVLLSNTYLIGPEEGGDAILIDPGEMDVQLLRLIERNSYYVRAILITLPQPTQVHGVKTLLKIYDSKLYGNDDMIYDCRCRKLTSGSRLFIAGYEVEVMDLTGEKRGPLAFRIENLVFTGTIFTAGNTIRSATLRQRTKILAEVDAQILSLSDDVLVLPGAGPPSSVRAERALRENE